MLRGNDPCHPRARSLQASRPRPLEQTIKPSTTFCAIRMRMLAWNLALDA